MKKLEDAVMLALLAHVKGLGEDTENEFKQGYVQGMFLVYQIIQEYNKISAPSSETPTAGEFSGNSRNN